MSRLTKNLILLPIFFVVTSCIQDKSKKIEKKLADGGMVEAKKVKNDFNKARQVFYSLPSPIETAMLIKRSGVQFNHDFINPESNKDKYITANNLAMALGVYTANMSYASIFNQSQTTIKYMSISKDVAENLGILNVIDKTTVQRLEKNINNRDSIMDIISSTLLNSDEFLKENERIETAILIIAGGWIEGLYLATQHAKLSPKNGEIIDRIIDQKISLQSLLQLMKTYDYNKKIKELRKNLERINNIYKNFKIVSSNIKTKTQESEHKTLLQAKTDLSYDIKKINKLIEIVDSLRTTIIEPNKNNLTQN